LPKAGGIYGNLRRRRTKELDFLNGAALMTPGFWQADVGRSTWQTKALILVKSPLCLLFGQLKDIPGSDLFTSNGVLITIQIKYKGLEKLKKATPLK
jgi:hypothetical protein